MSAVRRFMSQDSGYAPFVFKVDTSLGDGLPQMKIPIRPGYSSTPIESSINGGNWVFNSGTTELILPLPANSISTIALKSRRSGVLFNGTAPDEDKIISIERFGGFIVSRNNFQGCSNLIIKATDTPRLGESLYRTFFNIKSIDSDVLNRWEFSKITDFRETFYTMSEPITDDLNIYAPLATTFNQAFRSIGGTGEYFTGNITIDAPQATTFREIFRGSKLKNKIILKTPNNTSLYWAFNYNTDECDLSEVDVRNVTDNTNWIGNSLRTDYADQMLVNWDNLPFMQSGVNWNLRETQVTSIGKTAIDSMELKWGCTFSNYTVL